MRGVVTSLDRANRLVTAFAPEVGTIEATYLADRQPWPLATAWFDGGPSYLCLGPIGDRRTLVRDDFMVPTTADTVTASTVTSDIAWSFAAGGTGSTDAFGNPGAGAAGVRRLLAPTNGSSARIRAQNNAVNAPSDGLAVWMAARARVNGNLIDNGVNAVAEIGLGNANVTDSGTAAASDVGVFAQFGNGGANVYRCHKGTSFTTLTAGETAAADTWFWLDIVAISGEWAAFWVDGSGPYVIETDVPLDTDEGYQPFARVSTSTGATSHLLLDLIEVQLVNPVLHATDYALEADLASYSPVAKP